MRHNNCRQASQAIIRAAGMVAGTARRPARNGRRLGFAILLMIPATITMAQSEQEITWDDLLPLAPEFSNPLEGMPNEAQGDLFFIMQTETNIAAGFTPAGGEAEASADRLRRKLTSEGIDVSERIREVREIEAAMQRYDHEVVAELDQQVVRMPGYALPLEVSEAGVTEFLLVPYVGACIHTPPPPPNQMVLVELTEPHRFESIFDAVWLTGEMNIESSSQTLSLVDGAAPVTTGYKLAATRIEPYQW